MTDIRGIIFDLDGVIAHTAEFHYLSWKQLADEEGLPFTRADYVPMNGTKREENLRLFTQGLDIDEATKQAWMARKNRYLVERIEQLQPQDAALGILRLLDESQAAGIKVAIGSASRNAKLVLKHLQLTDRFEVIGDGNTVVNSKPQPDIFIWVAGALRLRPQDLLVIEDSQAGVQAARHGGFYVLGLGEQSGQKAHAHLPNLADVSLLEIFELVCHDDSVQLSHN
ncbi:MAG: beta-phosphoglucomutase family hydrolase [Anaerolineae bacterium]|nr:beta-phosphoglucomutase family hydrolase [Anaerolineae bacterium]MDQ7037356.1 beta-phosphoglucomutase family hydrolase [Anaerolineae bacterium]